MKMPPIEKLYEAYSVVADERIRIEDGTAYVISSDGSKEYTILFDETSAASNDNATYWQGYPGYPILALWMKLDILSKPTLALDCFKGINWKERNALMKRNYAAAVQELLKELAESGVDTEEIVKETERIYEELQTLDYTIRRNPQRAGKRSNP